MFFKKKDPEKEWLRYKKDRAADYWLEIFHERENRTGKYSKRDLDIAGKEADALISEFFSKYPEERGKNKKK